MNNSSNLKNNNTSNLASSIENNDTTRESKVKRNSKNKLQESKTVDIDLLESNDLSLSLKGSVNINKNLNNENASDSKNDKNTNSPSSKIQNEYLQTEVELLSSMRKETKNDSKYTINNFSY